MRKLANNELGRLDVEEFRQSEKNPVVVVLDNVRSLNNIGSIFRTCDAFRISRLILCGISTPPPHRDIHKTALGAELSVDWQYFENTTDAVALLKEQGHKIYALEQTESSVPLNQFQQYQQDREDREDRGSSPTTYLSQPSQPSKPSKPSREDHGSSPTTYPLQPNQPIQPIQPFALIFGNEIHGVSQDVINLCDAAVEIPQFGTKHSLNVAVSVGIVLWEVAG